MALLALETIPKNILGWFLFNFGISYRAAGAIHLWRDRMNTGAARSETASRSFWWLLPGMLACLFIPPVEFLCIPAILPRVKEAELAGSILVLLGLSLLVWTRLTIRGKRSGSLRARVDEIHIAAGLYRFVRHPVYTCFVLMSLGLALGYSSLIGLAPIPVLLLPGLAYQIKLEESQGVDQLNDNYQAYTRSSKKLIPGISGCLFPAVWLIVR